MRFPDGSEGELELVRHVGAAAVVPLYRRGEREGGAEPAVALLRQYRYAAGGEIWEIPAGKLEGEEPPEACARRELEEEAGLRAAELRSLTTIWTTPGFTDERIHLFLALGLEAGETAHEASEFIDRSIVPVSRTLEMVRTGRIADAKTICALLWAARFAREFAGD